MRRGPLSAKRAGFLPFLWHGFFLAFTMAMVEPNTVLPNYVARLTDSPVAFGALYAILLGGPSVFNLMFSQALRRFQRRKPSLIGGILVRAVAFAGMAGVTLLLAGTSPGAALWAFYGFVLLFALSGGFAGIAYSDIVARVLPSDRRPAMIAARQVAGGVAALGGGALVARILAPGTFAWPLDYALPMAIGAAGLAVAAAGFLPVREPKEGAFSAPTEDGPVADAPHDSPDAPSPADGAPAEAPKGLLRETIRVLRRDAAFRTFLLVENLSSFSLMVLPFYMLYVTRTFPDAPARLGTYVLAQVAGSLVSNVLWLFLSRRFGSVGVLRACIATGAALPLIVLALSPLGSAWYALVFLLVGFVTSGRNIGFEPYLLDLAPGPERTLYLGIRGSLNLLDVVLPLVGGLLVAALGFPPVFLGVSAFMLAALVLLRKASCPVRPPSS